MSIPLSHSIGVEQVIRYLEALGLKFAPSKHTHELEPGEFTRNTQHRRIRGWVPCDLTLRFKHCLLDVKVYRIAKEPFSSLFRCIAYGLEAAEGRSLAQVVVGDLPDLWAMFPRAFAKLPPISRPVALQELGDLIASFEKANR